uniref:Sugar phosphate transporter domain-containing protein n=1 Tax=Cyclophora tenuis TaxID=216820 RepID=A0A7S1GMC1_CYCTE
MSQFAGYAFWAFILARLNRYSLGPTHTKGGTPKVPTAKFIGLSLLRAFDLAVTNSAMQFLNYPAKTLIKSCRVVFTMFMGVLIRNKRYKTRDYIAVFTLVLGLIVFLHADSTSDAVFHPLGVILLTISLICDGTLNNWSEQMMEEYNLSQDQFHARLYTVSLIATVVAAALQNELFEGIDYFLFQHGTVTEIESSEPVPSSSWTASQKTMILALFGTTGILGASCLGAITKRFGALCMALTSTGRKATTLFLSFALFNNQCSSEHVVGVSLFMSGLLMKSFHKSQPSPDTTNGQYAGQETIQSSSPRWWEGRWGMFDSMLRRMGLRRLNESKGLIRKRSSIDMELALQTD